MDFTEILHREVGLLTQLTRLTTLYPAPITTGGAMKVPVNLLLHIKLNHEHDTKISIFYLGQQLILNPKEAIQHFQESTMAFD